MDKKYSHSEETKIKISIALKGKLKGKKRNPISVDKGALKRRRGAYFNCIECSNQFWRQPSAIIKNQNKFCSKKCYQNNQIGKGKSESFKKYCKQRMGEKSPTWKGGITPKNILIRNSLEYKEWRNNVFKRDNFTCQECNRRSCEKDHVYLEAHHIKPFATHPELRLTISNGITLCKECHSNKPKGKKVYEQYNASEL